MFFARTQLGVNQTQNIEMIQSFYHTSSSTNRVVTIKSTKWHADATATAAQIEVQSLLALTEIKEMFDII